MKQVGDWLMAVLFLAGIFVLVRPGSQGPTLVATFGNSIGRIVDAATGGQGWSGTLR